MELRDQVIEEARRIFSLYGVKAVRMDDIAANLGVSKRTIYETFGDKDTLIAETIMKHYHEVSEKKAAQMNQADNVVEELIILLSDWDKDFEASARMMSGLKKFYPKIYKQLTEAHKCDGHPNLKKNLSKASVRGCY